MRYRLTHGRWPVIAAALLALVILAGILVGLDVGGLRSRLAGKMGIPARVVRLAVLPFANISGDAEQDYLSDGLTTEMTVQLGRLHPETLLVIARTTAVRYKKTNKPVDQIGRELGVDYILEGSAQREAGRIRITADLIKVADQTQLWADRYERELAGILALQNEVAQQVAKALALKKGYDKSGYAAAWQQATEVELAKYTGKGAVAFDAATNYTMAGDRALALDWLEKAYTDRDPSMPFIGCTPIFDPLRGEPRFQALLRKMNLPLNNPPPTSKQ